MYPSVRLKKHEQRRVQQGHLWVFSNEIDQVDAEATNGAIVQLEDAAQNALGTGIYNGNSLISVRLLSRKVEKIDREFIAKRLASAAQLRASLFPGSTAHRMVHGESDLLPGLIIDRFNDSYVLQILASGMESMRADIADILAEQYSAKMILARNDSSLRRLEGLPDESVTLLGEPSAEIIDDGILEFESDLIEGQKTGFFFDQRENRKSIRPFSNGATVLDCFTNIGGFALHAASAGATEVIGIDSSERAIAAATRNAQRNNLGAMCSWRTEDVMLALKSLAAERRTFDVVVLDPPAYAKNKKSMATAVKAYGELQALGMIVLKEGGILATASCSHHVSSELFDEIIAAAGAKTRRKIQILERRGASPDHPVLLGMPETEYLKFRLCRVV